MFDEVNNIDEFKKDLPVDVQSKLNGSVTTRNDQYNNYFTQFRVEHKGDNISISELWDKLPLPKQNEILEKAKHITFGDDEESIVYDKTINSGLANMITLSTILPKMDLSQRIWV